MFSTPFSPLLLELWLHLWSTFWYCPTGLWSCSFFLIIFLSVLQTGYFVLVYIYLNSLTSFSVISILLLIPSNIFLFQMLYFSVLEFPFGSFLLFLFLYWELLSFHLLWTSGVFLWKVVFLCVNRHFVWLLTHPSGRWQLKPQFISFNLKWDTWVCPAFAWFTHQPDIQEIYTQNLGFLPLALSFMGFIPSLFRSSGCPMIASVLWFFKLLGYKFTLSFSISTKCRLEPGLILKAI